MLKSERYVYVVARYDNDVIEIIGTFTSMDYAEEHILFLDSQDEKQNSLGPVVKEEIINWLVDRVDYVFVRENKKNLRYYTIYVQQVYDHSKTGATDKMKYVEYANEKPGHYTAHIEFLADSDEEALRAATKIAFTTNQSSVKIVGQFITDADDWAEHIYCEDPPNGIRVGSGRRVLLDESGNIIK